MLGSPQWMYNPEFYPYKINNSAVIETGARFTRSPSSSNADTWTWSAWVKLNIKDTALGTGGAFLLSSGVANNREFLIYLDGSEQRLNVYQWDGGSGGSISFQVITSKSFRDPSAWYHIVVGYDSTQATASDRIKIYVNGTQESYFDTANYPSQNTGSRVGTTDTQDIGKNAYNQGEMADFYIAEVNFISGSQLSPASFGETKADTWIPKEYPDLYGTHDYYLDFATRATDPIDASGNGNNWSSVNVVSADWMPDSPTNNWATLNPIGPRSNSNNLHETTTNDRGNLTASSNSGSYFSRSNSTVFSSSGKWYYEIRMDQLNFGNTSGYVQFNIGGDYIWRWYGDSNTLINTGGSFTGIVNGDIIMIAVDQDNGKGWFGINGTWLNASGVPDPAAGTNPHSTFASISDIGRVELRSGSTANTVSINFGQDGSFNAQETSQGNTDANGLGDFYYAPPAGFLSLCSANLPDPAAAFNPAVGNSPLDHFNTVVYTGNGSSNGDTQSIDVGVDVDFVWVKNRSSNSTAHTIFDRLRGDVGLNSNAMIAEYSFSDFNMNNDNTIDAPYSSSSAYSLNSNSESYVAWNWKAGGSGSSNSDGTIASTVSANTDAGFSIVTYNGSGTGTVGHGLSSTPQIVIIKSRDASTGGYWWAGTTVIDGSLDYLKLNDNDAKADSGYATPTSSVFSNVTFTGSTNHVAYCFHSVEGFSKFGTYTGNLDVDGPFIRTEFRPAFVIIKRTDATNDWRIYDTKRSKFNDETATIYANHDLAEYTTAGANEIDTLSNGFKIRNTNDGYNAASGTYLYMAFAEMPFKYSNAR